MNINMAEIKVAGYYTFYLNGEPVFGAPSKNLITDFGWNKLFSTSTVTRTATALLVGTSNTAPSVTDTALGSLLATKVGSDSAAVQISGTDSYGTYRGQRFVYTFALGAVVGNVAEVGWKVASGDASISSRSLVKDGLGNPAVITVTASDQLIVTYELRHYINTTATASGVVVVAGVNTTWTAMAAANDLGITSGDVTGFNPDTIVVSTYGSNFVMGAVGTNPSGTSTNYVKGIGSKLLNSAAGTLTGTVSLGLTEANQTGGVYGILFYFLVNPAILGNWGKHKVSFSPQIPKDATKTLSISFTVSVTRL